MNSFQNDSLNHDVDADPRGRRDREITLGTATVLGIFFALAVLCAAFFGFGYSTGRRSAVLAASSASGETVAPASSFGGAKPSAGSPLSGIPGFKPATLDASGAPCAPPASSVSAAVPVATRVSIEKPASPPSETSETYAPPPPPRPAHSETLLAPVASVAVPTPPVSGTGQTMVQIAAVSHQEDADLLLSTLRRRGYSVAIFHEPQDPLLHVQIGPFQTRKEADTMRQRLLADGFNAIVKEPR